MTDRREPATVFDVTRWLDFFDETPLSVLRDVLDSRPDLARRLAAFVTDARDPDQPSPDREPRTYAARALLARLHRVELDEQADQLRPHLIAIEGARIDAELLADALDAVMPGLRGPTVACDHDGGPRYLPAGTPDGDQLTPGDFVYDLIAEYARAALATEGERE